MRNTSAALHWILLIALLASPVVAFAQGTTADHEPVASSPRLLPDVVLIGHTSGVNHAAFSPDGNRIVTTSDDKTARLWRNDGKQLAVLVGHTGGVNHAAFSPDGSAVVTTLDDGNARLWDKAGDPLAVLEGGGESYAELHPRGNRIVTVSYNGAVGGGTARLWDSEGKGFAVLVGGGGRHAEFSPDGSRIVAASDDNTALVYRVPPSPTITTAAQAVTQERATTPRDASEFRALQNLVFSADGAWLAAEERSERGDGNVRVWSTEGDLTFTIEGGQDPRISRDSRWVSARQKPPLEGSRTAKPKNKRAGQTLVLLDLQDGSRRTFDFVLSYDVGYASTYLIYLQSPETEAGEEEPSKNKATEPAAKPAAKERNVGTLHLVHLESDRVSAAIENVAQHVTHQTHATHQTTDHFAYVLPDEETGRDTLNIIAVGRTGGWGYRGTYEGEKIEGLCWARDPITVGFLDSTESTGKDGKRRVSSAVYTWHVTGPNVQGKFTRVAQSVRDDAVSRTLHNLVISADGAWMAAEERLDRGDRDVRVWSAQRDVSFTIERGQNPRISRDSRWVSALQRPPLENSRTAKPKSQRAGQTLVLLDTQDGSQRTFDFVLSYDMTYASTYLLYLQSPETKADEEGASKDEATKPATKERNVGTLHQIPLNPARLARILRPYQPDRMFTKENVIRFVTHPTNDHFAYVFHDQETGGETLHIVKWGIRALYKGEKIEGLCWGRDPRYGGTDDPPSDYITLGFLVSTETTGKDGKRRVNSALYTWQPDRMSSPPSPVEKFTRVDTPK